ncbi:MAG: site-specific DNA-methyltransferase [Pseudobacteriovorax sp.]|nr:site-specific DNA-methyltransferase [Pseudobacteriovorax sp.]
MKVKFGDIIKLGEHYLLCGDSSQGAMVSKFLKDVEPRLMITDPPYGVNYQVRDRKKPGNKENVDQDLEEIRIRNDHRTNWSQTFYHAKAQIAYVWYPSTCPDVAIQALRDGMYEPRQTIIWNKNRATLSRSAYHWKHESCLYGVRVGNNANWKGGRKQHTVWDVKGVEPKERIHPTQKPLELYTLPIVNHTDPGEIVYDPFAGSGVIFEACQKSGRIGYGVDLEPAYCRKIVKRIQDQFDIEAEVIGNVFDS